MVSSKEQINIRCKSEVCWNRFSTWFLFLQACWKLKFCTGQGNSIRLVYKKLPHWHRHLLSKNEGNASSTFVSFQCPCVTGTPLSFPSTKNNPRLDSLCFCLSRPELCHVFASCKNKPHEFSLFWSLLLLYGNVLGSGFYFQEET